MIKPYAWLLAAALCVSLVSALDGEEPEAVQSSAAKKDLETICPDMYFKIFEKAAPRADKQAGEIDEFNLIEAGEKNDIQSCAAACCEKKNKTCNVVFMFKERCYHVRCASNNACMPKKRETGNDNLFMVLVNPVQDKSMDDRPLTWADLLKAEKLGQILSQQDQVLGLNFFNRPHKYALPDLMQQDRYGVYGNEQYAPEDTEADMRYFENAPKFNPCQAGVDMGCPRNEQCFPISARSNEGICRCIPGLKRNHLGICFKMDLDYSADTLDAKMMNPNAIPRLISAEEPIDDKPTETLPEKGNQPPKALTVSVMSKNVHLPEKETFLAAYTVPDEQSSGDTYKYMWTLVAQPNAPMNGTISDQSKAKVKLTNLSEGLYTFKVTVTGKDSYGEAIANVTVLPEKRINKAPQVIITPKELTVKLPNNKAILDGSTSIDDDRIVKWHWELISGPIGYEPKLPELSTLQLSDLVSPGNYTFKLTVTDSDNTENSTTANITVLKISDYPPEANAGPDVILYLPHNNVTLNGTLSTDDREIVAWEWTKDDTVQGKAVDMQNTRTPFLQLSNLEEGMYTFVLKVTDGSGQSNSAKVHVFVKQPTNAPPVANAGTNSTISLPQSWILLNGSESKDDVKITDYYWKQQSGPNNALIANANASIANATGLTIGLYEFKLTVSDENKNEASDRVWVKVVQERNSPPVANAGGDQTITLPAKAIYLNASKSSDDLGIANYTWTREGTSLAAGRIVGSTDLAQVLILTDVVPGRYVFKLTVTDGQGLSNSDTVSIIVHPDPNNLNLVEMTLSMGISVLTQAELLSLEQKISLLLGDGKLRVRELKVDHKSDEAILIFYVERLSAEGKNVIVPGTEVQKMLKDKFWRDASILGTTFTDVRTTVCQNTCSNHGVCNAVTRACICETFWMPSVFYYWNLDEANCDWSILYVIIGSLFGFFALSGLFWGISCVCRKSKKPPRARPKIQKYALLGTQDDEMPSFTRSATTLTETDSDSDVLYENRQKPNGILRTNGLNRGNSVKYSSVKSGRRVKA